MLSRRLSARLLGHHLWIGAGTLIAAWALYITRPFPDVLTRLSFATAYPALVLLSATLLIGPIKALFANRTPISIDLRRDVGIWAGIVGLFHASVGQFVHLRGRPWLYYIYEDWRKHPVPLRHDLFGFTNFTGLAAAFILIALLATSNDISLRLLGTPGWKQLQRWNYGCFGLAALHSFGFLSMEKQKLAFVVLAGICVLITVVLQGIGFRRRNRGPALATNSQPEGQPG
jgi:sulfoxide reductase heme-binding subunit YedZ